MGGWAVLRFGPHLGVDCMLVFAPQIILEKYQIYIDRRQKDHIPQVYDLAQVQTAQKNIDVHILYNQNHSQDSSFIEKDLPQFKMSEKGWNIATYPCPRYCHYLMDDVQRAGYLKPIVEEIYQDKTDILKTFLDPTSKPYQQLSQIICPSCQKIIERL